MRNIILKSLSLTAIMPIMLTYAAQDNYMIGLNYINKQGNDAAPVAGYITDNFFVYAGFNHEKLTSDPNSIYYDESLNSEVS